MDKKKEKKDRKKSFHFVRRHDNTVDVAIRKNPAKTLFGKIVGILIIIGFVVLPIVGLVFAIFAKI